MPRTVADLIDIATARHLVLGRVEPLADERVPLTHALGRTLAEDVVANENLPPFDSSALDGFAVGSLEGGELPLVGESRAGAPFTGDLQPGQAIRISTGAIAPAGAAAVVGVERAQEAGDGVVRVPTDLRQGANIRRSGEDLKSGERVLPAGSDLGPAELAVLASLGREHALCGRVPRVSVLTTGDELVEPGTPLEPGMIRNSNAYGLAAAAQQVGAEIVARTIVRDTREHTTDSIVEALDASDLLLISGGVSVGPHDHVKPALAHIGVEEVFWRVALKPGKPTWFGMAHGGKPVFGLPGNPVSALVTFHLFARPALRRLAGANARDTRTTAIIDVDFSRESGRDQVLRCSLDAQPDGWHVTPTKAQGSHVLSSMVGARALALIPRGEQAVTQGSRIDIELLH
jgi:molybdopterin molybdotransferase